MPRKISEDQTRKEMIDPSTGSGRRPQLERAGWYLRDHSRVKEEIPVDGYDAEPWNGISDYTLYRENGEVLVKQQFDSYITQHNYNADQIRFLRAVQSVFLQKRHLETADLYEPPLDMFGADAVDRWFTEKEVGEIVTFVNLFAI